MKLVGLFLTLVTAFVDETHDQDEKEAHGLLQATKVHRAEVLNNILDIQQQTVGQQDEIRQEAERQQAETHQEAQAENQQEAVGQAQTQQEAETQQDAAGEAETQQAAKDFRRMRAVMNDAKFVQGWELGEASNCPSLGCNTADDATSNGLQQCMDRCTANEDCNILNFASSGSDATSAPGRCCLRQCAYPNSWWGLELTDQWKGWDVFQMRSSR